MRHSSVVVAIVLMVGLVGCETSVDPVVGTDKAFSLFGVLQPRSDTQWVRVYPIEDRLEPASPDSLAATFTSTELDGERAKRVTWRDSLIQEEDGRYAHVFWAPFRVSYDRTYRLEVTGDDGGAQVEVSVPRKASLALQEAQAETPPVVVPVLVNDDVPRLINLEVEYYFQYELRENVGPNVKITGRVVLPYDDAQRRVEEGWIVPINLSEDYKTLREQLVNLELWNPEVGIIMRNLTLRLDVVNEEWNPPGGELDPEVLVEPGVMSNVEGGFGFVGAGYRLTKQWTPSIEVLTRAGWTDPRELR